VLKKQAALKLESKRVMQAGGECEGVWGADEKGDQVCYPVPNEDCNDAAKVDADPWGLGMDCFSETINFSFACIGAVDWTANHDDGTVYSNEYCQDWMDEQDALNEQSMAKKYRNMSKAQVYQAFGKNHMVARTQLMQTNSQAEGFNYGAAAIGATAGLILTYGLLKTFKGKNTSDGFQRA
jgi:hypothetical protein